VITESKLLSDSRLLAVAAGAETSTTVSRSPGAAFVPSPGMAEIFKFGMLTLLQLDKAAAVLKFDQAA
jgi:hypothetical protein